MTSRVLLVWAFSKASCRSGTHSTAPGGQAAATASGCVKGHSLAGPDSTTGRSAAGGERAERRAGQPHPRRRRVGGGDDDLGGDGLRQRRVQGIEEVDEGVESGRGHGVRHLL